MKKGSIKNALLPIVCIFLCIFLVTSCGVLHSKDGPGQQPTNTNNSSNSAEGETSLDLKEVLANSVSTISIGRNGDVYLITPNGKVVDPKLLKSSPTSISQGEVVNYQTFSIFAIKGSPVEVRQNLGSMVICYVLDDVSWTYLGGCPREQYMRR